MIYIASGWWKPGHLDAIDHLTEHFRENNLEYYSPKDHNLLPENSTREQQEAVFLKNVEMIRRCEIMFARIDDYDPGTIWEMGAAYQCSLVDHWLGDQALPNCKIVAWSLVPNRELNMMLAVGCDGFINGWPDIYQFFQNGWIDWEVLKRWNQKPIVK